MTINKEKKQFQSQETILGIDPGLASTGWGVIKKVKSKISIVNYGCITTSAGEIHAQRLKQIHNDLKKIIKKNNPNIIAIEQLFFAKNAKTALKVSEVCGAIHLTAALLKIPIIEFTPLQIKQALTGYGRADKNQIGQMVKQELRLKETPKPDHCADALATAITCAQTNMMIS